jgi:hypothetical protein
MGHTHGDNRSPFSASDFGGTDSSLAGAKAQGDNVQPWVVDRDQRDCQGWDDREEGAYRRYLAEQSREYIEFKHQNHIVQRHYRMWRQSHPELIFREEQCAD